MFSKLRRLKEISDAQIDALAVKVLSSAKLKTYLFLRNEKGFAPVIALVIAMVGLTMALFIGLILNGKLFSVANEYDLGTTGNATRQSLNDAINSAYSITTIFPYILVGVIALSLIGGLAVSRGRQ